MLYINAIVHKMKKITGKEKGDAYEVFTKSHLLNNYEQVYLWSEIPMQVFIDSNIFKCYGAKRQFLKNLKEEKHPQDFGCDIIYHDGSKYIIVQCKDYTKALGINDVAGFYVICNSSKLNGELYYTNKLTRPFKNMINVSDSMKAIRLPMIEEIKEPDKNATILVPYDYQVDAYNKIKNNKRAILQLPCGLGKTLISIMYGKDFDLVIIFSPLCAFAQQNLNRYESQMNDYKCILVGSEGTRNPDELKQQMNEQNNDKNVLSSTYKSVDVINKLIPFIKEKYERVAIIVDEFHNLTKDNVLNETNDFYKALNHDEFNYLFMSATPRVYELEEDDENISNITGEICYKYEFRDAINNGYICDYNIYIPEILVKQDTYMDKIYDEIKASDLNKTNDTRAMFLLKGLDELGYNKCIAYLNDHAEADAFKKSLETMNQYHNCANLVAEVIISDTSSKEREKLLKDFVDHKGVYILCSVHILDECIDIPACDSIFLGKEIKSKTRIIQRICRSIRKDKNRPNKISGIFLWANEFSDMSHTVSTLKEFDSGFVKEKVNIMQMENEITKMVVKREHGSEKYIEVDKYVIGVKKMMSWNDNKNLLFEYCDIHKQVPTQKTKYNGKYIGQWLGSQKKKIKTPNDIIYIELSKNTCVKKSLDEYLKHQEATKNKKKLLRKEWIKLLFEYCDINKAVPFYATKYKDQRIGSFLQYQKKIIKNANDPKYIELSKNVYVKKSLDEHLTYRETAKNKKKLSRKEWIQLLFEYCDLHKTVPISTTKYRDQFIGNFLNNQKNKIKDVNAPAYIELSKNSYVKKWLDEYLKYRETTKNKKKLSQKESIKLLFEYCDLYKKVPTNKTEYKNQRIGLFLQNKKTKIKNQTDPIYIELSVNTYVKKSLDENLMYREATKDKEKISRKELIKLLFEYCDLYKKVPVYTTKYKNQPIGKFLHRQKERINNSMDTAYIELSENSYIKKSLDAYLIYLETTKDKEKLPRKEWIKLLFEYCDLNKKIPNKKTKYNDKYIGLRLQDEKKKIKSQSDTKYIELSENPIVKKSLDKCLAYREKQKGKNINAIIKDKESDTINSIDDSDKESDTISSIDDSDKESDTINPVDNSDKESDTGNPIDDSDKDNKSNVSNILIQGANKIIETQYNNINISNNIQEANEIIETTKRNDNNTNEQRNDESFNKLKKSKKTYYIVNSKNKIIKKILK